MSITTPKQKGGARPGAGRPAKMDGARRINIVLDEQTIAAAKALGAGNLSAGVREAVRLATSRPSRP